MNNPFYKAGELGRRSFMSRIAKSALGVGVGAHFINPALAAALPNTDKKLIFLYMAGGMSHLDTFDPHPGTKEGGPVKAIGTNVDGIQISEFFPHTAKQMDKLTVIRSMYSTQGAHQQGNYLMHTGYDPRGSIVHPTLGSWSMLHQGKINPALPGNIVIAPGSDYPYAGFLPPELGAVPIGDAGKGLQYSKRPGWVNEQQYHDQLELANVFDSRFREKYSQRSITAYQKFYDEAVTLMESEDLAAFDIHQETAATKVKYGEKSKFGQGCLLARRLIESGVRCVEVTKGGWDTHAEMPEEKARDLDRALAALMQDLSDRGLLESTIVVVATEFGRNPELKPESLGRDHWAKAFSTVIGGGGIKTGQIIGATDRGHEVAADKVTIPDLHATIGTAMGMPIKKVVMSDSGRPFNVGYKGAPVPGLI
ncbi:DUF1501 domain-containing protein [Pontiella agarivorans]|uniref:DUF1501 domain-containing protein n=1 Tax=Pontiella agarivorans TaxID=3038953 RepID=A0ABU5MZF6_9BACT|nr:DUF1501 domain-containing protein [Pontiella agarivorans]MDZ8119590.1 DUF1501 domain-containing protein [Pontiella agarivorans]